MGKLRRIAPGLTLMVLALMPMWAGSAQETPGHATVIELQGANQNFDGLVLDAAGSTVQALDISGFANVGLVLGAFQARGQPACQRGDGGLVAFHSRFALHVFARSRRRV